MRKNFFNKPSTKIILRYDLIAVAIIIFCAILLPILLNYPSNSINTLFDIQMSYISYTQQFIIIGVLILVFISIMIKILLRDIDKWYEDKDKGIYSKEKIIKIRKKCFNLPYIFFFFEAIVPSIIVSIVLLLTGSHEFIMILKIFMMMISCSLLLAVFSFVFSKELYAQILASTYEESINTGIKISLGCKICMQIIPIIMTILLFTSLVGYSRTVAEEENLLFDVYSQIFLNNFDTQKTYTIEEISNILSSINEYSTYSYSKFILFDNKDIINVSGFQPSSFVVEYTLQLSNQNNGKTYDSYAVDTQGAVIKLNSTQGTCYATILYKVSSKKTLQYLITNFILLLLLSCFTLILIVKSLKKDLKLVENGLNNIVDNNNNSSRKLPVVSNDEIGDLVIAFNKIQNLTSTHLKQIESNQSQLVEQERLASLGQLIGGIAHNLKTPIMSISGATEGLSDLIKEYDLSIDNPTVNSQDHHDIAKDMDSWIKKIKEYTEYMSDIITAVKGQAVTLAETDKISFTLEELVKRVDILMKHELKHSLIYLNTQMKVNSQLSINGDVNSLVQVINNMISNAIQAYNGKTEESITLSFEQKQNNLVISIKDNASGLPEKVKDKLFKEMITTKGKNGTGLGLYMSYSTIKAHFNGDITFESEEGKGTTFNIILPL